MDEPSVVFQLHVALQSVKPDVWRVIQVPEDFTLAQLHATLQIAMGWEDCHLHEFVIDKIRYGVPSPDDLGNGSPLVSETGVRLYQVLTELGQSFRYTYDFDDGWEHHILFEGVLLRDPRMSYPRCLAGSRQCPPEDVGGPPGYEHYLEALTDPNYDDHESLLEWRGPFDPEAFELLRVDATLKKRFRPRQKAAAKKGKKKVRP